MPGLEKEWIKQKDPRNIEIYDTQKEWKLVQDYIAWKKKTDPTYTDKRHTISRKSLKKFLKVAAHEKYNITEEDINHSFFIFPNRKSTGYSIGVLARAKSYIYKSKEYREGIMGSGAFGRVNPCRIKDSTACTAENKGKICAIKALPETNPDSIKDLDPTKSDSAHEVYFWQQLGHKAEIFLRDRSEDNTSPLNQIWIGDSKMDRVKAHLLLELAQGTDLSDAIKNEGDSWDTIQKLKIAIAIAVSIKELHDIGIMHGDIKTNNFRLLTTYSEDGEFKAEVAPVDLGLALQPSDGEGSVEGFIGNTKPGLFGFSPSSYSLAKDIFYLARIFKELGIDEALTSEMRDKGRGGFGAYVPDPTDNTPTIDAVIDKLNASLVLESAKTQKSLKPQGSISATTKTVRPLDPPPIQHVPRASQQHPPLSEKRPSKQLTSSATAGNKNEPEFVRKAREMQKSRDDDKHKPGQG